MTHSVPYDREKEKEGAEFTHNRSQRDAVDTTAQLENEVEAAIELSASFLVYVVGSIPKDQLTHSCTCYSLTCSNILC